MRATAGRLFAAASLTVFVLHPAWAFGCGCACGPGFDSMMAQSPLVVVGRVISMGPVHHHGVDDSSPYFDLDLIAVLKGDQEGPRLRVRNYLHGTSCGLMNWPTLAPGTLVAVAAFRAGDEAADTGGAPDALSVMPSPEDVPDPGDLLVGGCGIYLETLDGDEAIGALRDRLSNARRANKPCWTLGPASDARANEATAPEPRTHERPEP